MAGRGRIGRAALAGALGAALIALPASTQERAAAATPANTTTIKSTQLAADVDPAFPRVLDYTWLSTGDQLPGQAGTLSQVKVNGQTYTPTVTSTVAADHVDYRMTIGSIGVELDARLAVRGDTLTFGLTNVIDSGSTKVSTFGIPNQSLVSAGADQNGAQLSTAQVYPTYYAPGPDLDKFAPVSGAAVDAGPQTTSIGIVNTSRLAAAVESNSVQTYGNLNYQTETQGDGVKRSGVWSNDWTYRGPDGKALPLPQEKVVLTGDRNGDGSVDWQDGAIAYREIMPVPTGADETKNNVVSQIAMNLTSGDQNPFIKTLDDIKKVDLLTDGLGQSIELKGYQGQGHDSAHPDYAGHWNDAAGGLKDIQYVVSQAKKYNTIVGVHINDAMESPRANAFRWDKTSQPLSDYSFGDDSYMMSTQNDLAGGDFASRIDQLVRAVPGLGFIYSDAFFSTDWTAYEEAHVVGSHGLPLYTEFPAYIWPYIAWYHDSNEFNDVGVNSQILRFAYNSDSDAWIQNSNPMLLGEQNKASFMGWHSDNSVDEEIAQIFTNNLPTKYLQNFQITKWGSNEIDFTDGVKTTMNGSTPQIWKDGVLERDGSNMFLPWSATGEQKIYAWSADGSQRAWGLPKSWANQKSVTLYKLTDTGKTKIADLPVSGGRITLAIDKNTPYVVYPDSAVTVAPQPGPDPNGSNVGSPVTTNDTASSVDFGDGTIVKDGEFFTHGFTDWKPSSTSGGTKGVQIVTDSNGFQNLKISGPHDAAVSQTLTGLSPGHTYAASAYVNVSGSRTATVSVSGYGGSTVSNSIDKAPPAMADADNRLSGQNFQRVQVLFTVPAGHSTATLTLSGGAGGGTDYVQFTDVRAQSDDGADNRAGGHYYTEDFEHTTGGYGPFIPGQSAEQETILSEDNEGYTRDTISGKYSLETDFNSGDGTQGLILRTWPGTLAFKPDHTYRVRLDYQDDTAGRYDFQVGIDGASKPFVDIPLAQTTDRGLNSAPPNGPKPSGWTDSLPPQHSAPHASIDTTFTTPSSGDSYLGLFQNNDSGGAATLDNLVVDDLGPAGASDAGKAQATLDVTPTQFDSAATDPVTVTYTNNSAEPESGVNVSLTSPQGWTVAPAGPTQFAQVPAGGKVTATYKVTVPGTALAGDNVLTAHAGYTWNGHATGVTSSINATVAYASFDSAFDNVGVTDSSDAKPGAFDSSGDSYSASALAAAGASPGATVKHDGVSFTWPNVAAGSPDNVTAQGQTFKLSGSGELAVLGSAAGAAQDTVSVTYTDGSTSQAELGLADWGAAKPNQYGNQVVLDTQGDNTQIGAANPGSHYDVYYNTIPLDDGKTVSTVTLPNDPKLHIFAIAAKPLVTAPPTTNVAASDLQWTGTTNGWGPVERDHSNGENGWGDGNALTLNGTVYAKGLGTAPFSGTPGTIDYDLGGKCTALTAVIGLDDEELNTHGSVGFAVVADGKTVYTSGVFSSGSTAQKINVPLTGVQKVELQTNDGGDGNGNDHGDWADAQFQCSG